MQEVERKKEESKDERFQKKKKLRERYLCQEGKKEEVEQEEGTDEDRWYILLFQGCLRV